MKKIISKTMMAVIIALSLVFALISGLFFTKKVEVADAATTPMNVTFSTDKTGVFPGGTFKLTMKIEVTGETGVYHSVSIFMGLLSDDTTFDSANASLFTFSNYSTTAATNKNGANPYLFSDSSGIVSGAIPTEAALKGMFKFSLSKRSGNQYRPLASEAIEMSVDVTVNASAPKNTTYTFGAQVIPANFVNIDTTTNKYAFNDSAKVTVQNAEIEVREASTDATLTTPLKVGQGEDASQLTTITNVTETGMTYTATDPSMPLSVLPLANDAGATITLLPGDVAVKSGEIGKVTVPADGVVKVKVTAEDGVTTKEYEITVTIKGSALTNLVVANDTQKTGLTKNNLDLTATSNVFDPSVEAYTVYVPSDSTKVDITATVDASHNGNTEMNIARTGAFTIPGTTANSGTMFSLTDVKDKIQDDDTLTIECKDVDGYVTKTYVLTFDVVDVDTSLASVTVVGTTTKTSFENSTLKATDNNVDYYFMVIGETNASSTVTLTTTSAEAMVTLTGTTNKNTVSKTLNANTYDITVLAEAGNSESFSMILKNQEVLKLASDATADFIYKNVTEASGFTYQYLASYKKNSKVHGIDDINFERVVIGKIREETSVSDFVANFDSTQRSKIRVYSYDDELIYNCGNPGDGFTNDEITDIDYGYMVTTGWRVELLTTGGDVEDTVYVSMLGEVTGDGYIDGTDMAAIINYINGTNIGDLESLEFFLAALVSNAGYVSAAELTEISNHGNRYSNIFDDYYETF